MMINPKKKIISYTLNFKFFNILSIHKKKIMKNDEKKIILINYVIKLLKESFVAISNFLNRLMSYCL